VAKPTGFLEFSRQGPQRRPVELRLRDWREVYVDQPAATTQNQAARCMDCGIPFCHHACPLGNLIPEWNSLVYEDHMADALSRLHATNNFPEFTGRLCPAPCESACVLGIADEPVTIERLEYEIIERGWALDLVQPHPGVAPSGHRVVIVGSGPAGLAAAQQLVRVGHEVTVLERQEEIGGLLRFGIPEFKMQKAVIDRRLGQLVAEGVRFEVRVDVGDHGDVTLEELRERYDAVLLAIGSTRARQLALPGAQLAGVVTAMDYLKPANLALAGVKVPVELDARGRRVVILGGGDTGADCLGTALRQGARTVTQLEIMDRPPEVRPPGQPWPTMAQLYKVTSAHEEGGQREYAVETTAFLDDDGGAVRALQVRERHPDGTFGDLHEIPADLVLIAAGFVGPELDGLADAAGLARTTRDTIQVTEQWLCLPGHDGLAPVFAAGDAVRGQSLIVWALAEGRSAAAALDEHLRGATALPAPLSPYLDPWG
jgi:glutamate synthase (NADPH/NADH) small chain